MSSRHNARKAAVQALYQWDLTNQAASEIEPRFRQINDVQNIDKRYLRAVLGAVPAHIERLHELLEPHLDRSLAALDPVERAILRLGAYELEFCPDVPTNVIINEMVELAKIFGADQSYRFVNGVIDRLAKQVRAQ